MLEKNNIIYLSEYFMKKANKEIPSEHMIIQFNYHNDSVVRHITNLLINIKTMYNNHAFTDALIRAILTQSVKDAFGCDVTFKVL